MKSEMMALVGRRSPLRWTPCLVLCLTLGACGALPKSVYVDTTQAMTPERESLSVTIPPLKGMAGEKNTLPALPAQTLLAADIKTITQEALAKAKSNQDRLYQELRERLSETYEAELAGESQARIQAELDSFRAELDLVYEEIRTRFEAHALEVGPLIHRLSWLAGFPDPDPRNRRSPRGTYIERQEASEAAKIRPQLDRLNKEYREEISILLDRLAYDFRADMEVLDLETLGLKDRAALRAEEEARELSRASLGELEASSFDAKKVLAAVPGLVVERAPVKGLPAETWRAPNRDIWPQHEQLKSEALVFARSRGWRLSENGRGVPDKTQEFLEWRKSRGLAGSSTSLSSSERKSSETEKP